MQTRAIRCAIKLLSTATTLCNTALYYNSSNRTFMLTFLLHMLNEIFCHLLFCMCVVALKPLVRRRYALEQLRRAGQLKAVLRKLLGSRNSNMLGSSLLIILASLAIANLLGTPKSKLDMRLLA